MKVKILTNKGNEYYDQFIGQEFEAVQHSTGLYEISDIKTKTGVKNGKGELVGTQWFPEEVEEI